MRHVALGIGTALVVAGVAAAGIVYIPRLSGAHATPEQVAASVKPGFLGEKQIGAWKLICKKVRQPPARVAQQLAEGKTVTSQVKGPKGAERLTISVRIPPRPCWTEHTLENPGPLANMMAAKYLLRGPNGLLVLFLRIPVGLFPNPPQGLLAPTDQANPGGVLRVQWSGGGRMVPARYCEAVGCVVPMPIPPRRESEFLGTKTLVLTFPAFPGKQPKVVNVPTEGMAAAVHAMRRLEK